jgi:hypothetical protein
MIVQFMIVDLVNRKGVACLMETAFCLHFVALPAKWGCWLAPVDVSVL